MAKRTYTFLLSCGYAESASLSFMPFTSSEKYASAAVALMDLAAYLKEQYDERHGPREPKACCLSTKKKDGEALFCSKCRSSLVPEGFDEERFMDFVSGACQSDIDTFHGDYIDWDEDDRWQSDGGALESAVQDKSVRFVYTAEKVMAAALGHSPDDRVTIESIFKDRTKGGGKSFSFW